jgi:hypothetical protein
VPHSSFLRLVVPLVVAALGAGACELPDPEGKARDRPQSSPQVALPAAPSPVVARASQDAAKAGAPAWNPVTTRAVVAGVLTFADPKITTFAARNRKDQELVQTLVARGVPRANITVLLDAQATGAAVIAALEAQARAAAPGSTLLFYYAGHGTKAENGEVSFLPYDAGKGTPLPVAALTRIIAGAFKGADVLLLADCCHSGALIDAARDLGRGSLRATAITSAEASNTSTGNWTYTQTTIDALKGDPLADRNRDGRVDLAEYATEVREAMKHRERQRAGVGFASIPSNYVLGPASGAPPATATDAPAVGSYVATARNGKTAVARVLGRKPGSATIAFYDYSDFSRVEAPLATLEPVRFTRHAVGAKLRVTWGGKVWDADVLKVEDDFHLITYPGWSSWWDEWIASDRVAGLR